MKKRAEAVVMDSVRGREDCYVITTDYRVYSLLLLEEPEDMEQPDILLRNEITPEIRQFNQFTREGAGTGAEGDKINFIFLEEENNFLTWYRLLDTEGSGKPVLYAYAEPFIADVFPLSYSGFYSLREGRLHELVTGFECGGSAGGDRVCLWLDKGTGELLPGLTGTAGGFAGFAYNCEIYDYIDNTAMPKYTLHRISQSVKNYKEEELTGNAEHFYRDNGEAYTRENILDAEYVNEYSINEERVTPAEYEELSKRFATVPIYP